MASAEAFAWAREILGEPGPYVRETVPGLLVATHSRYVAIHEQTELADSSPYGLIWLGMPKALVGAFGRLADVQLYRPKRGRYKLPLVNGVPVIPWRYARDGRTPVKQVPFGRPVSDSRRSLFHPPVLPAELPLGETGLGDAIIDAMPVAERDLLDAYADDIRALATGRLVSVLAFASNTDALLGGYFGYATLGDDGFLNWSYCEPLGLVSPGTAVLRDLSKADARTAFDAAPLKEPDLRLRSPLEDGPSGGSPTEPTGTHE